MSYSLSSALQAAVYERLSEDAFLASLVGSAIYDEPLQQAHNSESAYVVVGEETVRPFDTQTSSGALHDFDVTVHSGHFGFDCAKRIAGRICAALVGSQWDLAGGKIVDIRFLRARAQRGRSPVKRTISLRFRAVVDGI